MTAPVSDYMRQPPAWFHARILVGAGAMLTPSFCAEHGISHVINCAFPEDSPVWFRERTPSNYAVLNAYDTTTHNILDWYGLFETTLRSFLREGTDTIFVHCQAGMNRSAFLALTYVAKNFHIALGALVPAVKRQRPCMFSNQVYMNQVKEFINGCIQSEEDPRVIGGNNGGDAGLGAPGDCTDPEGFDGDAGSVEKHAE